MRIINEQYICERCEREVNEMNSTCDDMQCPLFDPRYEEEDEDEMGGRSNGIHSGEQEA